MTVVASHTKGRIAAAFASESASRLAPRVLVIASLVVTCFEQSRLIRRISRYANADQALLWLAARDWSRLDIREPTFYGQRYGVTFEAIPTALLHSLGVAYNVALPTALVGLALSAWWWLAWCAKQSGRRVAAWLALLAPLILYHQHWVVVGVHGTGFGRMLGALCAGVVLRGRNTRDSVALAVALGGFAVTVDNAALLLVGPALLWAGLRWLTMPRLWPALGLGLVGPLLWLAFRAWFDYAYPDHILHPSWSLAPERAALESNWLDPDRLFALHAPELYPHSAVPLLGLLAVLGLALAARAWRELAAVCCLVAQLGFFVALPKSLDDGGTLWYPAARMLLVFPMSLWFVLCITLHAARTRLRHPLRPELTSSYAARASVVALLALAFVSSGVRARGFSRSMRSVVQAGRGPLFLELGRVDDLFALCRDARHAARAAHTNVVAFPTEGTADYACPALYPELLTAYPSFERRRWVLYELAERAVGSMILWGADEGICKRWYARKHLKQCTSVANGRALELGFEPQPPLRVLHRLGYPIRAFGAGCTPGAPETCAAWTKAYGP